MNGAWFTGLVCLLGQAGVAPAPALPAVLFTPTSAVEGAYADVQRLQAAAQDTKSIRYLSCYHVAAIQEIQELGELADFTLNSLNFSKRPVVRCPRLEAGRLLRVDLYLLGIDPSVWDRLGKEGSGPAPYPEPYFHQLLETAQTIQKITAVEKKWWPGGMYQGYYYAPGYYEQTTTKKITETVQQTILAQASWLPKDKVFSLVQWLDTEFPILRCDWFIVYALQPPAYVHFQGDLKKQQDLQVLAAVDAKTAARAGSQLRGAVLVSEVANRNRALERTPTVLNYGRGYYWECYDFLTSIKQNDLLKNLLQKKRDAGEIIWSLPNGLQGYGLINAQANIIEFADPRIAIDNRTLLRDKVVWTGFKCIFCHAEGIIPVADEVRLSSRPTLGFLVHDKKEQERVADLYFGEEINWLVFADQQNYAAAVQGLTGKAPAVISLQLQKLYQKYVDAPIHLETVCLDTGYPLSAVKPIISEVGRVGLDHTYLRLLKDRKGRRDQHEAAFAGLMQVLALLKETKP